SGRQVCQGRGQRCRKLRRQGQTSYPGSGCQSQPWGSPPSGQDESQGAAEGRSGVAGKGQATKTTCCQEESHDHLANRAEIAGRETVQRSGSKGKLRSPGSSH